MTVLAHSRESVAVRVDAAPRSVQEARGPARERQIVYALGGLIAAVHLICLYLQEIDARHPLLVALTIEGAVYAVAAYLTWSGKTRIPLGFILALGLALRLVVLVTTPYWSTDIYRYIWDGRVQAAGINPYLYVPTDPALSDLRDEAIWPKINRADYAPTIYPPAAQALFYLVTRISESFVFMKAVMVLFEGITVWALLRLLDIEGLPRQRVLVYAWCPLPLWEIAGSGHLDAAMIAFAMLAVLACRTNRLGTAGVLLGLATLVKLIPVVLLPALWQRGRASDENAATSFWRRWDLRLPAACAATIGLGYLPYLGVGQRVLGFLPGYATEEGVHDGSRFWLLRLIHTETGWMSDPHLYVALAGLCLAALSLRIVFGPRLEPWPYTGALALAAIAMFVLSTDYPWYFIWLLPFLCFVWSWAVVWLVAFAFILYWGDPRGPLWMTNLVYGGGAFVAAIEFGRHLMRRQSSGSAA